MNQNKLGIRFDSVYGCGVELPVSMRYSNEVISFSMLDWKVGLTDLTYQTFSGSATVPNYKASIRLDNGTYLGVVGNSYKIKQNVESFLFFDEIVKKHNLTYKYAGTIDAGKQIFITAVKPNIITAGAYGSFDGYYTIVNGHDRKISLTIIFHLVHANTNSVISIPKSICNDRIRFPHSNIEFIGANNFVCDVELVYDKLNKLINTARITECELVDMDLFFRNTIPRKNAGRTLTGDAIKRGIINVYNQSESSNLIDVLLSSSIWTTHYRDYSKCISKLSNIIVDGRSHDMNKKFSEIFFNIVENKIV